MSGNFKSRKEWLQDLIEYERANRHFATPKDGYPGTGAYVHDMISGGAKDDGTRADKDREEDENIRKWAKRILNTKTPTLDKEESGSCEFDRDGSM